MNQNYYYNVVLNNNNYCNKISTLPSSNFSLTIALKLVQIQLKSISKMIGLKMKEEVVP